MADEKVSAMPDIVALVASDVVPVVRVADTTNYKGSLAEIAVFTGNNVSISAGSLLGNPGTSTASGVSLAMSAGMAYDATNNLVSTAAAPIHYFNRSVPDLTPGIITPTDTVNSFSVASRYPSSAAENTLTFACTGTTNNVVARFITPVGDTGASASPPGVVMRSFWANVDAGSAILDLRTRVLHPDGTFTVIGAKASQAFSNTTPAQIVWTAYSQNGAQSVFIPQPTDRIYFELIAARVSGPTTVNVTIYFEGTSRYGIASTNVAQNTAPSVYTVNVADFGAVGNLIALGDGIIAAGSDMLGSATANFSQNDVGKRFALTAGNGLASPPATGTVLAVINSNTIQLSGTVSAGTTGIQYYSSASVVNGGDTGYYSPGVDTIAQIGGTFSIQAVANVVTTAVNPDTDTTPAFTIANAGSGGTPGAYLFVTTTQTGAPAYFRGTVGPGGTLDSIDGFVRGGIFVTNPGTAGEPITTAPGSPVANLTGATVNIASIGVLTVSVNTAGVYTAVPDNPVDTGAGSVSGATGCQLNVIWGSTGRFIYFTDARAAFAEAMNTAQTLASRKARVVFELPAQIYGLGPGAELPIFTTPIFVRGPHRDQAMVYATEGYTGRQIFGWGNIWPGAGVAPVNGPNTLASSSMDGAGLYGVTLDGDKTNSTLTDGIRLYDRCARMQFVNIAVQNMACAFRCGLITSSRQGLLSETEINDFNTLNCGTSTLPAIWLDCVGIGQGNNFLRLFQINVINYASDGIALTNHMLGNKRNSYKTLEADMIRTESPTPATGDGFKIGSLDSLSSIINVVIGTYHAVNPTTGRAGLAFYGSSSTTRPSNVSVNLFYQTAALGYGVAIWAGTGISIGAGPITSRTSQFITGNHSDHFLGTTAASATSNTVTVNTGSTTAGWFDNTAAVHSVPCSFTGSIATSGGVSTLTVPGAPSSGRLLVGSIIPTAGTTPNCTITALGTGTGGAGTYIVSPAQGTVNSRAMTAQYSASLNVNSWSGPGRIATLGALPGGTATTWPNIPISGESIQFQSLVDPDIFINASGEESTQTYSFGANNDSVWRTFVAAVGLPNGTGTVSRDLNLAGTITLPHAIITGGTLDGLNLTGMTANQFLYANGTASLAQGVFGTGFSFSGGTATIAPATTAALGGIIAGANTTINVGGTLSVASPGTGTMTGMTLAGGTTGLTGGSVSGAGGTITLGGTLAATSGGTGFGSFTAGTVPYAVSTTALAFAGPFATNSIMLAVNGGAPKVSTALTSNGVGGLNLGLATAGTGYVDVAGSVSGNFRFTVPNTVGGSSTASLPSSLGSAGQPWLSGGAGGQITIGTLGVAGGGTGLASWTANTLVYASGTATLAGATLPANWAITSGTIVPSSTVTVGLSNNLTDSITAGTYDLGPFIQGGTILNSYAHVVSGTIAFGVAIGQPGTYTDVTGLTTLTVSSTTIDTIGTATAANVISAGAHAWLKVTTGAPGGDVFITVKVP